MGPRLFSRPMNCPDYPALRLPQLSHGRGGKAAPVLLREIVTKARPGRMGSGRS
jgi:hypothetical protein